MLEQLFLKWMQTMCYRKGDSAHAQSISRKDLCARVAIKKTTMEQNKKELARILAKFKGKEKALQYYLAGFADGESSFSVAIIKHPTAKFGWMINPCFQVYQHEKHREILETFKSFCAIVRAKEQKEHLTIQGFKKVVDMAYTMNQQGKGRKHSKEEIFATLPKT